MRYQTALQPVAPKGTENPTGAWADPMLPVHASNESSRAGREYGGGMGSSVRDLTLADGSLLQVFVDDDAPADAALLVYHHGTPAAGPIERTLLDAARGAGLLTVELVRPGYGDSTRQPGRSVADVVPLVAELADHLGHERFVTLGWSGGGPHAIATAALLPDRCAGAISLAGVGPFDAAGLDFLAGMGQDNIEEFGAATAGPDALQSFLEQAAEDLRVVTGEQVVASIESLLPAVDQALLTGETGEEMAAVFRWALAKGIWGWYDDDLAFVKPWGFDLRSLRVPVAIWQGSEDLMVPFAHGQWLAANIASATPHLVDGAGHLSLVAGIAPGLIELRALLD